MTPAAPHPLPPRPEQELDLRTLCRAVKAPLLTAASAPPGWRRDVRIQQDRPGVDLSEIEPLVPAGVVDGAQCRVLLTVQQTRPVFLEYVGAAVVSGDTAKPLELEDRLYLAGSHLDADYLRGLPGGLPVVELDGIDSAVVGAEALEAIGRFRETLEAAVAVRVSASGELVVVDGSVRQVPDLVGPAVGVVKDCASTQHLTDEVELRTLPCGWRSTVFGIPAQRRSEIPVHSCYVRLHQIRGAAFTEGLVRLECTDPDLLDAAAAWAYRSRQQPGSGDPRWPCHLRQVRTAELFLKGRMPNPLPVGG